MSFVDELRALAEKHMAVEGYDFVTTVMASVAADYISKSAYASFRGEAVRRFSNQVEGRAQKTGAA